MSIGIPTYTVLSLFAILCTSCADSEAAKDQNNFTASNSLNLKSLLSHIPPKVKGFSDMGTTKLDQELPITIGLTLNNEAELDQRLHEMYRSGSPAYHHFISSEEFHSVYSPTPAQVSQVSSFLQAHGIKPLGTTDNRLFLHANGKVEALNRLFHTEIHQFHQETAQQGTNYFAPSSELKVPSNLPIQAIHGLQNVTRLKSYAHSLAIQAYGVQHAGSGPNGGYTPSDIQKAYNLPTNLKGSGQTLALFELDGYLTSDITSYEDYFGLPAMPLQNILVDQASGVPSGTGGANEVTLDIELMISMAPNANQIIVYEGPNTSQGLLDTYSKIADDNLARNVSTSWGMTEDESPQSFIQSENNIFKQMAAQGQSFFAASGDSGADDNGSNLSVDDPSSQPYVTAVGGTHLEISSDGTYESETTWNHDGTPSDGAGGGGISTIWAIPEWQTGLATSQNKGSNTMRNTPDVALNADPYSGYAIFTGGVWTVFGGTSCAAPMWAAFAALVNQQREMNGSTPLGFPNPLIYQIGKNSRYHNDFNDISDGSTNIFYPAVPGYDNATGWGSFNGQNLLNDLVSNI